MLGRRHLILALAGCLSAAAAVRADEPAPLPPAAKPVPAVGFAPDMYRSATPYNVSVVGRNAPNAAYNRHNFTLPCENPNQNFEALVLFRPECMKNRGCGYGDGCGKGKHKGGCSVGNCATCSNTYNFVWGGSRSYFGESSREFFERPPSVDAVRHKWNPLPVIYRTSAVGNPE